MASAAHLPQPGGMVRRLLVTYGLVALCTVGYYLLPTVRADVAGTVGAVVAFAVGLFAVSALIVVQVWRFGPSGGRRSSLAGVVAALYLAVLFFALVYFGLARHHPGSIAELRTRTDALYFALSVTSTVGFGDVHAVSQDARAVVAVHMAFNIGFLGGAVAVLRSRARR